MTTEKKEILINGKLQGQTVAQQEELNKRGLRLTGLMWRVWVADEDWMMRA